MTFNLASSGSIVRAAGKNVNTDAATSGAILQQLSNQAEHYFNFYTRYNFSSNASALYPSASAAIEMAVANLAACGLIRHDMSGYTTRGEAEDMIQHLTFEAKNVMDLAKDDTHRKFLIDGSTGVA